MMELNLSMRLSSLIVFLMVGCYETPQGVDAVDCTMKEFVRCSDLVSNIQRDGACGHVISSLNCVGDLIEACDLHPIKTEPMCNNTESYAYCSLLQVTMQGPMSSPRRHTSECKSYWELQHCKEIECLQDQGHFTDDKYYSNGGVDEESCPVKARKKCVTPMLEVTEVTKDSCIKAGLAKHCYLNALDYCSGETREVLAADLTINGLVHHVRACNDKGYGFTKEGDACPPNPLDAFMSNELRDFYDRIYRTSQYEKLTKSLCQQVHATKQKVDTYMHVCNVTQYNMGSISDLRQDLGPNVLLCKEMGFDAPVGTASPSGHPSLALTLSGFLVSLLLLLIRDRA